MSSPKVFEKINNKVNKTGDIMTGDLTIKKNNKASYFMINTDTNRTGFIETLSNNNINITNKLDNNNRTDLIITDE